VVARGLAEDARPVLHAAALGVERAEVEPADAGERYGGGAHRARLQGDVEIGLRQPLRAQRRAGGADGQHLGVRGGVGQLARAVAGAGENLATGRDDGANRHLAAHRSSLSLGEGGEHMAVAGVGWHDDSVARASPRRVR